MKPLHKHLSTDDKHRHFKSELGLVASEPKGGVSEAYKAGWDRIFNKRPNEDTANEQREKRDKET